MCRFITLILLFISFGALSNQQVPGIVIFPNETISVTFDVPTITFTKEWDFSRLQMKAYYYDVTGKKSFVTPNKALEIHFYLADLDTVRMISVINRGKKGRAFARIIREGKLNVYAMEIAPNTAISSGPTYGTNGISTHGNAQYNGYIMVRWGDAGPDVKAERLFSRKNMIEFFQGCPEVVREIEEQELTNTELPVVVDFYYQYCGDE